MLNSKLLRRQTMSLFKETESQKALLFDQFFNEGDKMEHSQNRNNIVIYK